MPVACSGLQLSHVYHAVDCEKDKLRSLALVLSGESTAQKLEPDCIWYLAIVVM